MITNELKKSPMYNLSMCSLENFHTNFINWLGQQYPKETLNVFLPSKNLESFNNIEFNTQINCQGKYIFDLYITMKNQEAEELLIVENKIKSYPTLEQLTSYQKVLEGKKCHFILLSLMPYNDLPNDWSCLNYSELAINMHKVFGSCIFKNDYHKYIINDYINVIENITQKVPTELNSKYDIYKYNNLEELSDVYIKYRTSELKNYLEKNLENKKINFGTDFRNKQGIINCFYDLDTKIPCTLLIQLQKNQYRYCMITGNENEDELRERLANKLFCNGYWFNNTTPNTKGHKYKEYCGYSPNFIYRYVTLENLFDKNLEEINYQEILEQIKQDFEILEKNKNKISQICNMERS